MTHPQPAHDSPGRKQTRWSNLGWGRPSCSSWTYSSPPGLRASSRPRRPRIASTYALIGSGAGMSTAARHAGGQVWSMGQGQAYKREGAMLGTMAAAKWVVSELSI